MASDDALFGVRKLSASLSKRFANGFRGPIVGHFVGDVRSLCYHGADNRPFDVQMAATCL